MTVSVTVETDSTSAEVAISVDIIVAVGELKDMLPEIVFEDRLISVVVKDFVKLFELVLELSVCVTVIPQGCTYFTTLG